MKIDNFFNEHFGNLITVVDVDQKIWFVGNQIAGILGYKDPKKAIEKYVHKHFKRVFTYAETKHIFKSSRSINHTPLPNEGNVEMNDFKINNNGMMFINEPGVYSLILRSKMPAAEEFQLWVFEDVLPNIRKHGVYMDESHIIIRIAGIIIRNFETRAISKFLKYSRSLGYSYNDRDIYKRLSILTNDFSNIETGQRNFSSSFKLLVCMLLEADLMDLIYNSILNKYDPQQILNLCNESVKFTLMEFIDRINNNKIGKLKFDNENITDSIKLKVDTNKNRAIVNINEMKAEINIYEEDAA